MSEERKRRRRSESAGEETPRRRRSESTGEESPRRKRSESASEETPRRKRSESTGEETPRRRRAEGAREETRSRRAKDTTEKSAVARSAAPEDMEGLEDDEKRALEERKKRRERRLRREQEAKRKQQELIRRIIMIVGALAVVLVLILILRSCGRRDKKDNAQSDNQAATATESMLADSVSTSAAANENDTVKEAKKLAAMYDYDAAIALLSGSAEADSYADLIKEIQEEKASCIAYDPEVIPHFFYHSLLNDDRGFIPELSSDFIAKDNACWMCSTDEFNTITQQMYDYGVVLVTMRDMVKETVDSDGDVHFEKNDALMLPPGKHPAVMSEDDLSYYHAYDDQGIAEKLIIDDSGKVKCIYTDESGEKHTGDYDVVPLLSTFIDEHPDFSYHNAHCIIALTGYNGVLGYRTDEVYATRDPERLDEAQKNWLDAHPDFDFDEDVAEATRVANAMKAEGFEFASHTWGHRHIDTASLESLMTDTERFEENVIPIVGPIDTIIFAHGSDLQGPSDYSYDNEKFAYYKNHGYNYYSNVDGSVPYWNQIRDNYVRTARIDIDGYRLYQAMIGNQNSIADMEALGIHDIESFFNKSRITPVEIIG